MNFRLPLVLILAIVCRTLAEDASDIDVNIADLSDVDSETTTTTTTTPAATTTTTTTTTTPAATTTTTTPAATTTTTTSTTEATTTTSTIAPPTTTIPPAAHYLYNITENNVTCIMLDGKLSFKIVYNIGENKTNISIVEVPKPSSTINVTGTCSANSQYIEIGWEHGMSNIRITFEEAKDHKTWKISNFTSAIYLDQSIFINATDSGQVLDSKVVLVTTPADIPVNHSLKCYSSQTFNNVTTTMQNATYLYSVQLLIDGLQLQAFNLISHQDKFTEEVHCDADKIADVVPIAVGCALAALVVIVLIAYIVGRRRRSAAYQSV